MQIQSNQLIGIIVVVIALLLPKLKDSGLPDITKPTQSSEAVEMIDNFTEGLANAYKEGSEQTDKKDYELNAFMLDKLETIINSQSTKLRQAEKDALTKDGVKGLQAKWRTWSDTLKNKKLK